MASGIFYIAAAVDDGYWDSGAFYSSGNDLSFGYNSTGGRSEHTYLRFSNVTIPINATIDEAYIRLRASYNESGGQAVNTNIYFNDVDDAVAPTNVAEAAGLALTGAVAYNTVRDWVAGTYYNTSDLKTILQTVVNRAGWNSGNAVQALIKDNSAARQHFANTYEAGVVIELHVTWTKITIDADVIIPSMTAEGLTGIYSASSLPMVSAEGFTGIHSTPSIPMIRGAGTLSDNLTHIQSNVTIPSMTASIVQAEQIWGNATIPSMTALLTERETVLGNATIPMITAELSSGLHADLDASAPMMIAEGLFSGQCEATVPMMTVELEGTVGRIITAFVSIPMITVSATGKTEHLGNISVSVPMMLTLAELITGKIIAGTATIPMITAELLSHEEITGEIDVTLPLIRPFIVGTVARAECQVLRYEEPV